MQTRSDHVRNVLQLGKATERMYKTYRSALESERFPLAYVDLDLFDENCAKIARMAAAHGKQIRIHTKSLRVPALMQRILDSSPVYQGLMCFSPREAVHLCDLGFDDILIAYPYVHRQDIKDVLLVSKQKNRRVIFMFDDVEQLRRYNEIAEELSTVALVCMDVDMSSDFPWLRFGVWRSPIRSAEAALQLGEELRKLGSLRLEGIMGYEAQIAGVGDADPSATLQNYLVKALKVLSKREVLSRRGAVVEGLRKAGFDLSVVNGGGTGSIDSTCAEAVVTEVTVGSGFYSPALFDYYSHFKFKPAAGYAIEIVRKPADGCFTCAGGGYVASGGVAKSKMPQVYLPEGCQLDGREGVGEVQTPVFYTGSIKLDLGDPILLRHPKAGEVFERFEEVVLLKNGQVVGREKTYRGQNCCFL